MDNQGINMKDTVFLF